MDQVVDVVMVDVGTTVVLMANSPGFSPLPVDEVVLPDSTWIVQRGLVALNTDPATATVVVVEPEPAPPAIGDEPCSTSATVYPIDRNLSS